MRALPLLALPLAARGFPFTDDVAANVKAAKGGLRGPVVPVLTHYMRQSGGPLRGAPVDHFHIAENVKYLVSHGVTKGKGALLAAASGGDFPVLNVTERKAIASTILNASRSGPGGADDAPAVLLCCQHTDLDVVLELAKHAEDIGAWGIQLSVPYYWSTTDEDAEKWFTAVHQATSRVGILFYNVPWEGQDNGKTYQFIQGLAAKLPRLVGLKWAVGPPVYQTSVMTTYMKGVAALKDRLAIVDNMGVEVMNHMIGGTGFITHLATVWPESQLAAQALMDAGNYTGAQQMFQAVNWPWSEARGVVAGKTSGESPTVKAALDAVGRYGGPCRAPSRELTDDERAALKTTLVQIGVPGVQP